MWEIPVPGVSLRQGSAGEVWMGSKENLFCGRRCKALEMAGGVTSPGRVRENLDVALEDVA